MYWSRLHAAPLCVSGFPSAPAIHARRITKFYRLPSSKLHTEKVSVPALSVLGHREQAGLSFRSADTLFDFVRSRQNGRKAAVSLPVIPYYRHVAR